jgi:hypothetical protein
MQPHVARALQLQRQPLPRLGRFFLGRARGGGKGKRERRAACSGGGHGAVQVGKGGRCLRAAPIAAAGPGCI